MIQMIQFCPDDDEKSFHQPSNPGKPPPSAEILMWREFLIGIWLNMFILFDYLENPSGTLIVVAYEPRMEKNCDQVGKVNRN